MKIRMEMEEFRPKVPLLVALRKQGLEVTLFRTFFLQETKFFDVFRRDIGRTFRR